MARLFVFCCLTLCVAFPITAESSDCAVVESRSAAPGVTPTVELVFVLDATGSMGGLIEGAKTKIWSIVNVIAGARPTPEIRIGILVYRDRGDAYVTRSTPLTGDLDVTYAWLIDQRADGGGDGPESVRQALHEAVQQFDWSNDAATLRLIYLVGDAPPHDDYTDDVLLSDSIARAGQRGILINTIQCGEWPKTTVVWRAIAEAASGYYFRVDQSGGMIAQTSSFDEELARHARLLEQTVVTYGVEDARDETIRRIDEGATAEALAERAAFKAGDAGRISLVGDGDLVRQVLDGHLAPEDVARDRLPEPLRSMTVEQLRAYIEMLAERRRGLREELEWLAAQRSAELDQSRQGDDAFDRRVVQSLRCQAAGVGLTLE